MAGRGPAPKSAETRRRRNVIGPERGDWVRLPAEPFENPPKLPRTGSPRGGWSPPAKREWTRWWSSPMAHMWDASDVSNLEMLLMAIDSWWNNPTPSGLAQIRQLKDSLGLTPKGRQDRRWRLPNGMTDEELEKPPAGVTNLAAERRRRLATD